MARLAHLDHQKSSQENDSSGDLDCFPRICLVGHAAVARSWMVREGIGHRGLLGDFVDTVRPVALRTGTLNRVRREGLSEAAADHVGSLPARE